MSEIERLKSIDVNGAIAQALREQAEREKGCEHCRLGIKAVSMNFPTTHEYGGTWWSKSVRTPKFCPMCGKRLEVKHE